MKRVVGLSSDELLIRERVFDGLTTRAVRLSLSAVTASIDALITAAATPELSSNPSEPNPTIPAGALGVVTTTWVQAVDARLFPFVVQTFVDAAEHIYAEMPTAAIGFDAPKITYDMAATYLSNAKNRLVGIGDVVWAGMRAQLVMGYEAGESIEQLANRLQKVAEISQARALTIARTEVVPAANFGSLQQLKLAGFTDDEVRKEWLATDDKRTRESHREADGQLVGLNQPFEVDGDYLQVPGDPRGRADNVINCRCSVGYVFDEDDDEDEPMIADAAFESKHPRDENGRFGTKSTFQILPKEMRGRSGNKLYAPGMLGQYGGAGIMMRHVGADGVARYMVVQRGGHGNARWRWQLPGGSREERETAAQAAAREAHEEIGVTQEQLDTLEPRGAYVAKLPVEDKDPWTYSVALADAPEAFRPKIDYAELGAARWLTYDQLLEMRGRGRLITPFAAQLDDLIAKFDDPLTAAGFCVTHMTTSDDYAGYYDVMIAAKRWDESKVKRDSEGQFAEKASTAVKIKTPLHVNTAVIYKKGGYADGAVIAEKNDPKHGPMRLIWSQPAKKFILQAGLDDGGWMSVETYGKGQAYDKFSKETGWFKPSKAQPKAPASLKAVASQKVADEIKTKIAKLQEKTAGLGINPALKPKTTKIDPAVQQLLDFEKTPEPPKTSGMEWLEARAAAYKKAVANREAYAQTGAKQAQIAQFVGLWTGASTQETMKKAIAKGEYAEVVEAAKNAPAPTLYRGFTLKKAKPGDKKSILTHGKFQGDPDKFINDLKPGFEIDLGGMASFTEDEEHAGTFGDVTFVMKDGHGLPIEGISNTPFEHEWLVTGKMRVESVAKKGKKYVVEVSHVTDAPTSTALQPKKATAGLGVNLASKPKKLSFADAKMKNIKDQLADGDLVDQMSASTFISWFSQNLNVGVWDKLDDDEQAKVYSKATYAANAGQGSAPLATINAWGYVKPTSKLNQALNELTKPKPEIKITEMKEVKSNFDNMSHAEISAFMASHTVSDLAAKYDLATLEQLDSKLMNMYDNNELTLAEAEHFSDKTTTAIALKKSGGITAPAAPPAPPAAHAAPAGIGKPIHINTAVIYKTKFADGAVVAEKDLGNGLKQRLKWRASIKKFDLEESQDGKPWMLKKSFNKGEAYKKFSKETGWTHPVAAAPAASSSGDTPDPFLETAILMMTQSEYSALSKEEKIKLYEDSKKLPDPAGVISEKMVHLVKTHIESNFGPSAPKHVIDMNESELLDWIGDNDELINDKTDWPTGAVGIQLDKHPQAYDAYWKAFFNDGAGFYGPKTGDSSDVEDFLEVTKPEMLKWWINNATEAKLNSYGDEALAKIDDAVLDLLNKGKLSYNDAVDMSGKLNLSTSASVISPITPDLSEFLENTDETVLAGWMKNLTPTDIKKYTDAELGQISDKLTELIDSGDISDTVAQQVAQKIAGVPVTPSVPSVPVAPLTTTVDKSLIFYDFDDTSGPSGASPITYNGTLIAWAKSAGVGESAYLSVAESDGSSGDYLGSVQFDMGETIEDHIVKIVEYGDLDLSGLGVVTSPNPAAQVVTPPPTPTPTAPTPVSSMFSPKASKWHIEAQTNITPLADIGTPKTGVATFKQTTDAGMKSIQEGMKTSWTSAQRKSIARYVKPKIYQAINGVLRDDKRRLKLFTDSELTQAVADTKNIQDSMAPLTESLILHRGTGAQSFGFPNLNVSTDDLKEKLEGKIIREKGFTSTSVVNPTSVPFDYAKKPIKVIIRAPEGTPALYISSATDEHENQNELLLGAGTSFKVFEVREADAMDKSLYGDYVEQLVILTVVPEPKASPTSMPTPAPSAPVAPTAALKSVTFNKPIKITTTLIYKNKYAHGAVVGYQKSSSGSISRLVWNANTKKFIEQNQNPDGSWTNFAGYGKGEAYQKFGKTTWYAPPSGDSAIGSGGSFGTTTVAPKVSTSAPAPSTSVVASPPAPVKQEKFDADVLQKLHGQIPSGMWNAKHMELFDNFKKKSIHGFITLSTPESNMFDSLHETLQKYNASAATAASAALPQLNLLQLLRIIDEQSTNKANAIAKNEGKPGDLVNAQLYEKKLVAWLQTPDGAEHATNLLHPPPPTVINGKTYTSPIHPTALGILAKIKSPYSIGTPDASATSFETLTSSQATALQKEMLAVQPWTSEQQAALRKYTGNYYGELNPFLRDKASDIKYMPTMTQQKHARAAVNIQDGMRPLPKSIRVFRKTAASQFGLANGAGFDEIKKLQGQLFVDRAPLSTSVSGNKWSGNVHITVDVPAGTPAAYVDNISENKGELEMLLAQGLSYRITSVTQGSYGVTNVHIRVEAA